MIARMTDPLQIEADSLDAANARAERWKQRYDTTQQRLDAAKRALVETGYFSASEVSDDIAPRIIELHSALDRGHEQASREVHRLNALLDDVTRERDGYKAAVEDILGSDFDTVRVRMAQAEAKVRAVEAAMRHTSGADAAVVRYEVRAALSSAGTGALDDLLDRERAKAAGEALREAADNCLDHNAWENLSKREKVLVGLSRGERQRFTPEQIARWLRDRAAAVSPEGGEN